jgi:hypothetical protein
LQQIKVEILIPLYYNDKRPIEDEKLLSIFDTLVDQFGACSIDNSTTQGRWKHPQTKVTYDDIGKIYWVLCEDNEPNREFFKDLQDTLMRSLEQESILIYYSTVSMI